MSIEEFAQVMSTRYIKCSRHDSSGDVKSVEYSNSIPGETVGTKTKQGVIEEIMRGEEYETAVRKTRKWRTEEVRVHDGEWLRVDGEKEPEDDLGDVPDCTERN